MAQFLVNELKSFLMKIMNTKSALFILMVGTILSACTSSTSLQVLKPAEITLEENIINVGVINRTYPTKENKAWNIVEGLLTGEGIGTDRRGSEATVDGMIDVMSRSPRFKLIRLDIDMLKGSGTGQFPEPLTRAKISEVCQRNNLDALIALEAFDSDSRVNFSPIVIRTKVAKDVYKDLPGIRAESRMNVTVGWRVYNYKSEVISDEFRYTDFLAFSGQGLTQNEALANLPSKYDALFQTGFHTGKRYGHRITPLWVTESRAYYNKGNDQLKKAARMVRSGNWEPAAEIWKKEALSSEKKIAGRACYNMAVFCETRGNFDIAIEWSQKAYNEFNNKKARSYTALIKRRMLDRQVLQQQMAPVNKQEGE
jgi:hypothetical protein